ncbi:MAG TPA: type II toxin-antitoxin system prevent-host-death family antitoxin [Bryobacteraceae bacterium]|jgi:prevent-host-death family protein|nr:type II toxin-antitoxin system prevent-host-death family antitoxin [Bryobacteraceae bacterium]
MKLVGIKEGKAHLSALVADAMDGEVVIISKHTNGKGVRLVPIDATLPPPSGFGMFADRFKDLPSDYWTNPEYDGDFGSLFTEEQ